MLVSNLGKWSDGGCTILDKVDTDILEEGTRKKLSTTGENTVYVLRIIRGYHSFPLVISHSRCGYKVYNEEESRGSGQERKRLRISDG